MFHTSEKFEEYYVNKRSYGQHYTCKHRNDDRQQLASPEMLYLLLGFPNGFFPSGFKPKSLLALASIPNFIDTCSVISETKHGNTLTQAALYPSVLASNRQHSHLHSSLYRLLHKA
jgi:hypothetical protein